MTTLNLPFGHPAWIEIDLRQFKKNLEAIRNFIGKTKLCIPIKANAYGHGLISIARAAVEARVDYLAVSSSHEGVLIRKAGLQVPIFVMGAIHEEQIASLIDYQLEFSISSHFKAELVAKQCQALKKKCIVHVEIDTGMQRTGVRPETGNDLLNYLFATSCFEVKSVYSHLATADRPNDEFAKQQIQQFKNFINDKVKKINKEIICHLANSGGVCYYPESHLDMVRPGLLCFGYFPSVNNDHLAAVKPFFSVKAKISYFKAVKKGQGISYGHTYLTKENTRIVTIPIGYGDGYRRALSNKGEVLIRGKRFKISGTICMDQLMVDIDHSEAHVGEEIILIGKQGDEEITVNQVAHLCDTISYEILCGFNYRLPRVYIDDDKRFCEFNS